MIFKPEMVEKILAGEKTVTRRPARPGNSLHGPDWRPCRYEVGKTYAVQPGRGQKGVGRIRVLAVRRKPLGHYMLTDETLREGFQSFTRFRAYWEHLYGSYDPTQLVDRIEFELVSGEQEGKQ